MEVVEVKEKRNEKEIWLSIAKTTLKNFGIGFGAKITLSFLFNSLKWIKNSKKNSISLLINDIYGDRNDSFRWGMFMASLFGGFRGMKEVMKRIRGKEDGINSLVSGGVSGLSVLFLNNGENMRRSLALYLFVRTLQNLYESAKKKGFFKSIPGSNWPHLNSLFFALSCMECLYAYLIHPHTLPPSYNKFFDTINPLHPFIKKSWTQSLSGIPIDFTKFNQIVQKTAVIKIPVEDLLYTPYPKIIPCYLMHPHNPYCISQSAFTFKNASKTMFPLYCVVTLAPLVLLRFKTLLTKPVDVLLNAFFSILRSTAFVSSCVTIYQMLICIGRRFWTRDPKYYYYLVTFLCSWSILIEKRSRRTEFALYIFTRTLETLYHSVLEKKLVRDLKGGSIALFCFSTAFLLYFREYESDTMAFTVKNVGDFCLK